MRVARRNVVMRLTQLAASLVVASALPIRTAVAQTASMPELDQTRAWLQVHQPRMISGDSGVNAAIVIVDTAAQYVRSTAFRLSAAELDALQAGVAKAVSLNGDTASTNLISACVRSKKDAPPAHPPICVLDSLRVQDIAGLRFFASRKLEVLKREDAIKRYGADASNGAVVVTTDVAALDRYTKLGAAPENFVSFQTHRTIRRADRASVVITVLMLR